MTRMQTVLGGTAAFLLTAPPAAEAQVPRSQLTTADATYEEAFSFVQAVRELPDGRILVADPLGQALIVLDRAMTRADTLGRVGQGPGEYRQPDAVFPLPGDSTLLVDLGNARLTALGPDFSFGPTMPIAQGAPGSPGPRGMTLVLPNAVDGRGRVYFQGQGFGGRGGALPDSAPLLRFDRATGTIDTVATVKLRELTRRTSGGAGNQSVSIQQVPLSPQDGWAVAADGRIAVVRVNPYSVEWIHADGRVVRGPQVAYDPVPIRRAEKEDWVNRLSAGLAIGISVNNGQRQMSFSRGGSRARNREIDGYPWPDRKPPFNATSVWVAPDGRLWVERELAAGQARMFDVFDTGGQLTSQVVLPAGRQIVGFGNGTLYTIARDQYDLQYLERYRTGS